MATYDWFGSGMPMTKFRDDPVSWGELDDELAYRSMKADSRKGEWADSVDESIESLQTALAELDRDEGRHVMDLENTLSMMQREIEALTRKVNRLEKDRRMSA